MFEDTDLPQDHDAMHEITVRLSRELHQDIGINRQEFCGEAEYNVASRAIYHVIQHLFIFFLVSPEWSASLGNFWLEFHQACDRDEVREFVGRMRTFVSANGIEVAEGVYSAQFADSDTINRV